FSIKVCPQPRNAAKGEIALEDQPHRLGLGLVHNELSIPHVIAERNGATHPHALAAGGGQLVPGAPAPHLPLEPCWFPAVLKVITVIRPETLVRWHRAGFRRYWRWKSRSLGGRPQVDTELRALIRRMSVENPLWGAPRIHGELLKLGFEVAQSTVAK